MPNHADEWFRVLVSVMYNIVPSKCEHETAVIAASSACSMGSSGPSLPVSKLRSIIFSLSSYSALVEEACQLASDDLGSPDE